jgi:hypothetical protein
MEIGITDVLITDFPHPSKWNVVLVENFEIVKEPHVTKKL